MRRSSVFALLALAVLLEPLLLAGAIGPVRFLFLVLPLTMFALTLWGAYTNPSLRRGVVPATGLLIGLLLFGGNTAVAVGGQAGRSAGLVPLPFWLGDNVAYVLSSIGYLADIVAVSALLLLDRSPSKGTRYVVLATGSFAAVSLGFASVGHAYNTLTPSWAMTLEVVGLQGLLAIHQLLAVALAILAVRSRGKEMEMTVSVPAVQPVA